MDIGGYIVFHPDRQRECIAVAADAVIGGAAVPTPWTGRVWVDQRKGNEDPWVFSDPWLYSYCHATQLRRSAMHGGETVFFVSGDEAEKGLVVCDTVFVNASRADWPGVGSRRRWQPASLPDELVRYFRQGLPAWHRHLTFGLDPKANHAGRHTFIARHIDHGDTTFSFLPLAADGERVRLPFEQLPAGLVAALTKRVRGKYPVLISQDHALGLYQALANAAAVRVVGKIAVTGSSAPRTAPGCSRFGRVPSVPGCR